MSLLSPIMLSKFLTQLTTHICHRPRSEWTKIPKTLWKWSVRTRDVHNNIEERTERLLSYMCVLVVTSDEKIRMEILSHQRRFFEMYGQFSWAANRDVVPKGAKSKPRGNILSHFTSEAFEIIGTILTPSNSVFEGAYRLASHNFDIRVPKSCRQNLEPITSTRIGSGTTDTTLTR